MRKFISRHPSIIIFISVLLMFTALNYSASFLLAKPASYTPDVLEKIHGKGWVEDYEIFLSEQGIGQKYYPFVEYIERARKGKYINVSDRGTRCHYSDREACVANGGNQEIWIFGGSTTFGYGVKDNETIPAFLSLKLPGIKIVNFGAASYYSTIERIRFENLLTELPPPLATVFIDGLNDFYYFDVPDKTMVSDAYSRILNKESEPNSFANSLRKYLRKLAIYRLVEEKFGDSSTVTAVTASREQILKAISRLNINHSITEAICDKLGITIINVIQPVPLYGVGHKTSKVPQELLNYGDHVNSGAAYKIMFTPNSRSPYTRNRTLNLANLASEEGMYVDTVHYSPLFNERIASEIHERLLEELSRKHFKHQSSS